MTQRRALVVAVLAVAMLLQPLACATHSHPAAATTQPRQRTAHASGSASAARARGRANTRQVRWFVADLSDTLALVRAHPRSLTGIYPGFSAAGMNDDGTFAPAATNSTRRDRQSWIPCDASGELLAPYAWATTFAPLGLTVEPVIDVSAVALVNGTAHLAIPALVRCAVNSNITGYMCAPGTPPMLLVPALTDMAPGQKKTPLKT